MLFEKQIPSLMRYEQENRPLKWFRKVYNRHFNIKY